MPGAGSTFTAVLRLWGGSRSRHGAERKVPRSIGQHVLLALDRPIERQALRLSLRVPAFPSKNARARMPRG